MKIVHTPDTAALAAGQARPAAAEARPTAAGSPTAGASTSSESATVKLSSTAAGLMASTPEFDAEKVAAIRQAIADGTFKPNAEAIADKLIANAQELLQRR
ncbi:flagellar biosynthesis anti-sigma factor FlgM [Caldimonas caldifontis]|uniref:Negative regulator of flagellin synthesis n=1 Tax=Caldimonas caldifontis TaxID=1452508 RepID=A0A2S5SYM9_9BURK|nr:flagellar biosynthesis anti-sigma factor FlgM [Caldimonas caldifontis]PPE67844.1 flagellar biosynthesis anti-sigma factor FlgM [Caldimonas caldifontis]